MLPLIPLRNEVWFPGDFGPLFAGRPETLRAIASAEAGPGQMIFVALRDVARPAEPDNLYRVGVRIVLVQVREEEPGLLRLMAEAKRRVRLSEISRSEDGFLQAEFAELEDPLGSPDTLSAVVDGAVCSFDRLRIRRGLPEEARKLLEVAFRPDDPRSLPSAALRYLALGEETHWISVGGRQALLETNSWLERIQEMTDLFDAEASKLPEPGR
jgi:ATP-dependent Lon protease